MNVKSSRSRTQESLYNIALPLTWLCLGTLSGLSVFILLSAGRDVLYGVPVYVGIATLIGISCLFILRGKHSVLVPRQPDRLISTRMVNRIALVALVASVLFRMISGTLPTFGWPECSIYIIIGASIAVDELWDHPLAGSFVWSLRGLPLVLVAASDNLSDPDLFALTAIALLPVLEYGKLRLLIVPAVAGFATILISDITTKGLFRLSSQLFAFFLAFVLFAAVLAWALGGQRKRLSGQTVRMYEHFFEYASDALFIFDTDWNIISANPVFEQWTGLSRLQLYGRPISDFFKPEDINTALMSWPDDEDLAIAELRFTDADNSERIAWIRFRRILVNGIAESIQAIASDITERVETENALRERNAALIRLSLQDQLTGIGNRRAYDLWLDESWNEALRSSSSIGLMLIDIDHFKRFNDSYGHQSGDSALTLVAQLISRLCRRESERCARYGGEEFAVIVVGADTVTLAGFAERIRKRIEGMEIAHPALGEGSVLTVSVGSAVCTPSKMNGQVIKDGQAKLVNAADRALYHAKQEGRNRSMFEDRI